MTMTAAEIDFRIRAHVSAMRREFPDVDIHVIVSGSGLGCFTLSTDEEQFKKAVEFLANQFDEEQFKKAVAALAKKSEKEEAN